MMGTMAGIPFRAVATLLICLLSGLSHAQDNEPYEPDPPERAARLSYIEGEVSLQPAGEEDWAPAIVNRPLTTGDKLWAEPDARAEIQVGPAAVRLGSNTGFSFLNVDDHTIQMRVTSGILNVSVRTLRDSEQIEIDTPNVALSLLRPGNYRVEVNDAGESTVVKVSEGELQATGPSQDIVVHAQQVVTFTGVDELVARHSKLGAPDEFDSWSLERDRRDERVATSRTAEYVAPDVTGYQDLEDNGTWSSEPDYGYVWTPRVAVGWAPYSYGRWVWVSPWGWSWIDDSHWGYAPFHYGRWAHVRNRWCWVPGPRHHRAVYAPALVGWVGAPGSHVSWFPLGPREVYVPGRRFSRYYLERVNFANTNVSRAHFSDSVANRVRDVAYRNRAAPGGVTAVPRSAFTSAGRTGDHRARVSEQVLERGIASAAMPSIAPVRESRLGGSTRANVRVPPPSIANRQVVVRRDPPPAAARFARRPAPSGDFSQTLSERVARPVRNGNDRPPRVERPSNESVPPARSSVFDRHAIADAVREDRDRQVRGGEQQRREAFQQREALQQRARNQRQAEVLRQVAERQVEQRQRSEQRQQSEQRERNERPRAEQPRAERPQVERSHRAEAQRPAESRPQPRGREGGNTRPKRD